jgi:hypothetical protein
MEYGETEFRCCGKAWFYVSPEGTLHRITKIAIVANGTRDLCIAKGLKPGSDTIREIAKTRKERILYVPLGDILWINIFPPYKGTQNTIIMDAGYDKEHMKPLVRDMLRSVGAEFSDRGDRYDAHLGSNYFDES